MSSRKSSEGTRSKVNRNYKSRGSSASQRLPQKGYIYKSKYSYIIFSQFFFNNKSLYTYISILQKTCNRFRDSSFRKAFW